ncbi:mCG1026227, partial [Mus musculus]
LAEKVFYWQLFSYNKSPHTIYNKIIFSILKLTPQIYIK